MVTPFDIVITLVYSFLAYFTHRGIWKWGLSSYHKNIALDEILPIMCSIFYVVFTLMALIYGLQNINFHEPIF